MTSEELEQLIGLARDVNNYNAGDEEWNALDKVCELARQTVRPKPVTGGAIDKLREALDDLSGGNGLVRCASGLERARAALDELAEELAPNEGADSADHDKATKRAQWILRHTNDALNAGEHNLARCYLARCSENSNLRRSVEAQAFVLSEREASVNEWRELASGLSETSLAQAERIQDLESQLSAQPKALEWREPSTAPRSLDDATPALLVWNEDDDLHMARCDPHGCWFDEYGEELFRVGGYLLPSDLPKKGPGK
jgi:hypothetical protein